MEKREHIEQYNVRRTMGVTYLDVVNWMIILHAPLDDSPHGFESLERAHDSDRISLHKHIATSEEFNSLS